MHNGKYQCHNTPHRGAATRDVAVHSPVVVPQFVFLFAYFLGRSSEAVLHFYGAKIGTWSSTGNTTIGANGELTGI